MSFFLLVGDAMFTGARHAMFRRVRLMPTGIRWHTVAAAVRTNQDDEELLSFVRDRVTARGPTLLRHLTEDMPDELLDRLEHTNLKELLQRHTQAFAVTRDSNSDSWQVQVRASASASARDEVISLLPTTQWVPITDLYASLSDETREEAKTAFKTLRRLLEAMDDLVTLSSQGTHVGIGDKHKLPPDPDTTDRSDRAQELPPIAAQQPVQDPPRSSYTAPVDTAFIHMDGGPIPPPPPSTMSAAGTQTNEDSSSVSALSITMLCDYIPTFFVPADEALESMPGYTLQHLEQLFLKSKSLQVVRVADVAYVRLHGWFGYFPMDAVVATNHRFAKYEMSSTKMMEIFGRCFPNPGTWRPLSAVVKMLEKDAQFQALPFQGAHALLYFAQHQHLFAFTADNGGAVAAVRGVQHLGCAETPCPLTVNEVFLYTKHNPTDLDKMTQALSPEARLQLQNSFPNWQAFAAAHSQYFLIHNGVIVQRRDFERKSAKDLPLEEQLEQAYRNQDKKKIRSLRRRIAVQANPDNPLLDADNLARTVADFLPPDRSVKLLALMKKLPRDVTDLLPNSIPRFFKNHPTYFKFFEWRYANNYCVCRAEVPLPDGVLRGDYDDLSLLAIVVRLCQKKNPQSTHDMLFFVPAGARDALKKRGGIGAFLARFPENFVLVQSSMHARNDAYICTMVAVPTSLHATASDDTADLESGGENAASEWTDE
jgi:hypothetical protein